jgi:hypothetical protein
MDCVYDGAVSYQQYMQVTDASEEQKARKEERQQAFSAK